MLVQQNIRIPTRGGFVAADVFLPETADTVFPVLITAGVYGKDTPFKEFNHEAWERSELKSGSGAQDYMVGEIPLPDYWVEAGYAVVRCDQPGSGRSPGDLDVFGPGAQTALYDAVEWAGTQFWSNGKVGILGASYYGVMAWLVAAKRPPHLAAILPFQGFTDHYRDCIRHGGILTAAFVDGWFSREVIPRQFGSPKGTSDERLFSAELSQNTAFPKDFRAYLRDETLRFAAHPYYAERTPDVAAVEVPIYVWANDDGFGLHLRGTIEGFNNAWNAPFKALRAYSGSEPDAMYSKKFSDAHRRFFDHFLKGESNGFTDEPPVRITVRKNGHPFVERVGWSYPLEDIQAKTFYFDVGESGTLVESAGERKKELSYVSEYDAESSFTRLLHKTISLLSERDTESRCARFMTSPLTDDLEIIGSLRLHLTVSVDGTDADLFVAVREIDSDGNEVTSAVNGSPISLGWQRLSMRHEDSTRSSTFRVWHTYDRSQPLEPGVPISLDVNLWHAAWIVAAGNRLAIEIAGGDQTGSGEFKHPPNGPFAGADGEPLDNGAPAPARVTIHTGGDDPSYLFVPVLRAAAQPEAANAETLSQIVPNE